MHEIITLQLGEQSNFVGTHFWNTQESYFTYGDEKESVVDHNIHFRPGIGSDGVETFTPRVLIYDFKGAFGTLRRENALYGPRDDDAQSSSEQWAVATNTIREPVIPQSEYQLQLNTGQQTSGLSTEGVRYWSDYNHIYYHPRSLVYLCDAEMNSSLRPFDHFETGEDMFTNLNREYDLLDRDLRPFLEECDEIQGIQCLSSVDNAWGGFAASYVDAIRDELGGKCSAWVWALQDGERKTRERQSVSDVNVAQSTLQIASQASLYIPITTLPDALPEYVRNYQASSRWHSSALQAAGIESFTMFSRLRSTTGGIRNLDHCEAAITNNGKRRIANLKYQLDPADQDGIFADAKHDVRVDGDKTEVSQTSTDVTTIDLTPFIRASSRGRASDSRECVYAQAVMERGTVWRHSTVTSSQHTTLLFPILNSFPNIFAFAGIRAAKRMKQVAAKATLSTSSVVATQISALAAVALSLGAEEREAVHDGLENLREEYQEGHVDSDDDDNN